MNTRTLWLAIGLAACAGSDGDCPKEKDLGAVIEPRVLTTAYPGVLPRYSTGTASDQAELNDLWAEIFPESDPPDWQANEVIVWAGYQSFGCGELRDTTWTAYERTDGGNHFELTLQDTTASCNNTTCDDELAVLMVAALPRTDAGTSVCTRVDGVCDPPEDL